MHATREFPLERARHADAVFVHAETLVRLAVGERQTGHQVVLVGGEDFALSEQ